MSNPFSGAKTAKGSQIEKDYLGGGQLLETDIYSAKIKYAFIGKSNNSKARCLTLCLLIGDTEINRQIWMTNGEGEVTFKNKKTGELENLPGYNQVNALAMLLVGKEIGNLEVEEKTLKLYDFDAKKELPQAVDCFTELHDMELQVAIQRQTVDKTEKNTNTGEYEPTGETRDVNEFIKFFPADRQVTVSEVAHFIESLGGNFEEVMKDGDLHKAISKMPDEPGHYATTWLKNNKGQTWDKSVKNKKGGKEGKSFEGSKANGESGTKKKSASLFDD